MICPSDLRIREERRSMKPRRGLSPEQVAKAQRIRTEEGLTLRELGERFGVSPSTVGDALARKERAA